MDTRNKLKCTLIASVVLMAGSLSALTAVRTGVMQLPASAEGNIEVVNKSREYGNSAPYSFSVVESSAKKAALNVVKSGVLNDEDTSAESVSENSEFPAFLDSAVADEGDTAVLDSTRIERPDFNVECYEDIFSFQVNKSYNIPAEFYYEVLPESMHELIEPVCALEREYPISSMFLFAVAANEVGWGKYFVRDGNNNWFNWSPDGEYYQGFESTQECVDYTRDAYAARMFNPEYYAIFGQVVGPVFTIPVVNTRYAMLSNGEPNTQWGAVVGEITYGFIEDYKSWSVINHDM